MTVCGEIRVTSKSQSRPVHRQRKTATCEKELKAWQDKCTSRIITCDCVPVYMSRHKVCGSWSRAVFLWRRLCGDPRIVFKVWYHTLGAAQRLSAASQSSFVSTQCPTTIVENAPGSAVSSFGIPCLFDAHWPATIRPTRQELLL